MMWILIWMAQLHLSKHQYVYVFATIFCSYIIGRSKTILVRKGLVFFYVGIQIGGFSQILN